MKLKCPKCHTIFTVSADATSPRTGCPKCTSATAATNQGAVSSEILDKLFARAYILRVIGELDAKTSNQLMKAIPRGMYSNADEALNDYKAEGSITIALVDWIKDSWQESAKSPHGFADEALDDFLSSIE